MGEDIAAKVHLIFQDNQSTIAMVAKRDGKPRTKYIKVCQEYVHERLSTSKVEVQYVSTQKMLADLFTKAFGGERFHTFAEALLGKRRFLHSSNKGAKSKQAQQGMSIRQEMTAVTLKTVLALIKRNTYVTVIFEQSDFEVNCREI